MTISQVGSATTGGYATTSTANKPTGLVEGDYLVANIYADGTNQAPAVDGFTERAHIAQTGPFTQYIFTKKAGPGEPASYDANAATGGVVLHLSGWHDSAGAWSTDPFDQFSAATGNPNASAASITPSVDGCAVILATVNFSATLRTPPSGYTELSDADGVEASYKIQTTATATGALSTSGGSGNQTAILLSFKPAVGSVSKNAAATIALKSANNTTSGAASIALKQTGLTKSAAATVALLAAGLTKSAGASIALLQAGLTKSAAATIALAGAGATSVSAAATIALKAANNTKAAAASLALKAAGLSKSAGASVALLAANTKSAASSLSLLAVNSRSAAGTIALKAANVNKSAAATIALVTQGQLGAPPPSASVAASSPVAAAASSVPAATVTSVSPTAERGAY